MLNDDVNADALIPPKNPAIVTGESVVERIGNGHRIRWPLHDVTLEFTELREEKLDVLAHVTVTRDGMEPYWGKLNLAAARSRAEVAKKLERVRGIPWALLLERSCRLAVQADRAGNPLIRVVARPQTGVRHLIAPLAPIGVTTVLYGPGGGGKGYLATALALAISSSAILPAPLQVHLHGPVIYLDWESTEADFAERLWNLRRGLGWTGPDEIHHLKMDHALTTELAAVQAHVHRVGAVAVIVDSLVPASGTDPETAGAAQRVFNALRTLDPVTRLILAHVNKATAAGTDPGKPFGSVFIENLARSTWEIRSQEENDGAELLQTLRHDKVNTGRKHPPFAFRFSWDADPAEVVTMVSDTLPKREPTQSEQLEAALRRNGPQTVIDLAHETGLNEARVRTLLNRDTTRWKVVSDAEVKQKVWALRINT